MRNNHSLEEKAYNRSCSTKENIDFFYFQWKFNGNLTYNQGQKQIKIPLKGFGPDLHRFFLVLLYLIFWNWSDHNMNALLTVSPTDA